MSVKRPIFCPACESSWVGFPVPARACVVRVDGAISSITLAHKDLGIFLDIDDVDTTQARCLDCFHEFGECSHCHKATNAETIAESVKLCGTNVCEDCRDFCEDCSLPARAAELDRNEDKCGVRCCDDCAEKRDEADECQCPGGEELGRCYCPACGGK